MSFEYLVEKEGVSVQNISFDPQGCWYRLTPNPVKRWWQRKLGWQHYVGHHYLAFDDCRVHRAVANDYRKL